VKAAELMGLIARSDHAFDSVLSRYSPVTGAGTGAKSDLASRATSAVATDAGTQAALQLIHRPCCAMRCRA
jgi:hypothetical protein